jgi:hypothetical protein
MFSVSDGLDSPVVWIWMSKSQDQYKLSLDGPETHYNAPHAKLRYAYNGPGRLRQWSYDSKCVQYFYSDMFSDKEWDFDAVFESFKPRWFRHVRLNPKWIQRLETNKLDRWLEEDDKKAHAVLLTLFPLPLTRIVAEYALEPFHIRTLGRRRCFYLDPQLLVDVKRKSSKVSMN